MTEIMQVVLASSANDVWGAIIDSTTIYPKALSGLYQQIQSVNDDGFTAGSSRIITFGPLFNLIVPTAKEKILDIDYENLSITSTFTDDGGFVPTLFDTFNMKLTVVRSGRFLTSPSCSIKWEFTYTGSNGNASLIGLQNVMKQAFKDLDVYLSNNRGIRPWP